MVWTVPSPWINPSGASVSSLYTFPLPGLARRWHGGVPPTAFADFTEVLRRDFARRDPFESPALPLSYRPPRFSTRLCRPPQAAPNGRLFVRMKKSLLLQDRRKCSQFALQVGFDTGLMDQFFPQPGQQIVAERRLVEWRLAFLLRPRLDDCLVQLAELL